MFSFLRQSGLVVCLTLAPAHAADPIRHSLSIPSTITLSPSTEGGYAVESSTTRFQVYETLPATVGPGAVFPPRLATITTWRKHPGGDERGEGEIRVRVQDLSRPDLPTIVEFADPGSEGQIAGRLYFVTTEPGCCALPSRHRVRALESGRAIFTATGAGEMGTAIWMSVPNAKPTIQRWAAYDAADPALREQGERVPARIGVLRYGDPNGALSTVMLTSTLLDVAPGATPSEAAQAAHEDVWDTLTSCVALGWVEKGKRLHPMPGGCPPMQGYYDWGESLFSLERKTAPDGIGGFKLELSGAGTLYASIPIERDRLDVKNAVLAKGIALKEMAAR